MKKLINKILVLIFVTNSIFADIPKKLIKTSNFNNFVENSYEFRSDNMIAALSNNGLLLDYHLSGDGLKFKNVVSTFQKSVWLGGLIDGSAVGVIGDYTQDMGTGPYGSDPSAAASKIYFVDLEMMASPGSYDDFQNWPVNQGAPYVDANGDGAYNPLPDGTDYPEFIGDKVAFFVSNDGDPAYKNNMGSAPTNVEFQFLVYSFDQAASSDLANSLFFKVLLINKGTDDITQTYVGLWTDDDVGYAGNDLVGVSVPRSLAYTYSDGVDDQMTNAQIDQFVVGHDFLQGPMVNCIAGGSVSFDLEGSDSEGDALEYVITSQPSQGSLSCSGKTCTYTPTSISTFTDTFNYKVRQVNDTSKESAEATVTIYVSGSKSIEDNKVTVESSTPARYVNQLPQPDHKALMEAMKEHDFSGHHHDDGHIRCATDELEQQLQIVDPQFIALRNDFYDLVEENKLALKDSKRSTVNIPVIFHVLYYDESDNISLSQIGENFDQLNDDFKNENSDKENLPKIANKSGATHDENIDYNHYYARGDHDVQFVGFEGETLGSNLVEHTSVRRYKIGQESVSGVSEASTLANQTATDGPVDGGYQEGYLNIYIAPLSGGLLGMALLGFPETVVDVSTVGSLDAQGASTNYGKGRTLTHEIGHNFTYNHVFASSTCSDTLWSDIPAQTSANYSAAMYDYTVNEYETFSEKTHSQRLVSPSSQLDHSELWAGLYHPTRTYFAAGNIGTQLSYGINNKSWQNAKDSYLRSYGGAQEKIYPSSPDNEIKLINGSQSVSLALTDTTTYTNDDILSSDTVYFLRVSGSGTINGSTEDAAYNIDNITSASNILMDGIEVRPSKDAYNNQNYYDYFFIGKDAKLSFKMNNVNSSNVGNFTIELFELKDVNTMSTRNLMYVEADSTLYMQDSKTYNNIFSYINFVFPQTIGKTDSTFVNGTEMNQGIIRKLDFDLNTLWTYETAIDSTTYLACGNGGSCSQVGISFIDVAESISNSNEIVAIASELKKDTDGDSKYAIWIYRINKDSGALIEKIEYSSISNNVRAEQFIAGEDAYYLTSYDYGSNSQATLTKLNSSFSAMWSTVIESNALYYNKLDILQQLPNNQGIVVGGRLKMNGSDNGYIALFNEESGNKSWTNHSNNTDFSDFFGLLPEVPYDSTSVSPDDNFMIAASTFSGGGSDGDYSGIKVQRIRISNGEVVHSESLPETGVFHNRGFWGWSDMFYTGADNYAIVGQSRKTATNEYFQDQYSGAYYNIVAVNLDENTYIHGKDALNTCIGTTNKGDQFMNYMDYVHDSQMNMFSAEQVTDGYSWALSYDWFDGVNAAPTANNMTINATVGEDCSQGAKMFGTYHPGKKNLPASSFSFYINGDAIYTDPSDITQAYNGLQGLRNDGSAYPNDVAGDLYDQKFTMYGDPTQTHSTSNPVDGNYAAAADRRSMLSIGPFTFAAGDSQEIVFNTMHATGSDGLDAVQNLFTVNDSIQSYYDSDFSILADNNQELTLDISESVTSGVAPLAVTFSLVGSPSFTIYNWDFNGDGVIDSKSLNPTYVFNEAGTYNVSLAASYKYYENGRFFLKQLTDSVSIDVTDSSSGVIVIASDTLQVNEDETGSVALSITNDGSRNFDLQLDQQPVNGSAYFDETTGSSNTSIHTLYYTPNDDFNGSDSLSVFAKDGSYESASAMFNITVLPVDDTPSTQNVSATVNEDDSVVIYLSASEVDGDDYEFEIKENPSNGSISAILSAGNLDSLIYTPDANWFGSDQFKFEAKDSSSRMNVGIATIQVVPVNDAPTTNALSVNTYEDVTTPIELDFTDIDSDQLTISYSTPSNGSISLNGSYLEYTPTENYFGQDSLTFSVNDGEFASNTSTISITIDAVNDASSDFSVEDIYIIDSNAGEEWVVSTNSLIATKENQEDSLQFNWNESFDIDGDKIQYRMIGFNDLEFLTMDDWITDLTLSWSIKDLVANTDTVNVAQGSWMIVASDGEFFVESNFGNPMELSINGSALIPDQYSLNQNYPNPFKNFTTISYDMPENQKVKIRIFDVRGRVIRTLINEDQSAGFKSILWDGKNEDGDEVSAGVYFYQMYAPSSANFKGITKTKRMVKFD